MYFYALGILLYHMHMTNVFIMHTFGTYRVTNGLYILVSMVPRFVFVNHIATAPDDVTVYHTIQCSTIHRPLLVGCEQVRESP